MMLPSSGTWLENATKPVSPTNGVPLMPPIGKTLPQYLLINVATLLERLLISSGQKDVPSNVLAGVKPNSFSKTALLRRCTADPGSAPGKNFCKLWKHSDSGLGPLPSQLKTRSWAVSSSCRIPSKESGTPAIPLRCTTSHKLTRSSSAARAGISTSSFCTLPSAACASMSVSTAATNTRPFLPALPRFAWRRRRAPAPTATDTPAPTVAAIAIEDRAIEEV
mmetsp:Transcript_134729/g.349058  ORF Transcript_134729/g.349058 Transcript_134729/m.349058 type:complete len:222 (+) Transcript_134729:1710-2375(+)